MSDGGDTVVILDSKINQTKLDEVIEAVSASPSFNENTRLMMSDATLYAIGHNHFYNDRIQTYKGIKIIENKSLQYGEIVILTQFV